MTDHPEDEQPTETTTPAPPPAEPTAQWPTDPPTDPAGRAFPTFGAGGPVPPPGGAGPWQRPPWDQPTPYWSPPPFERPRRRGAGFTALVLAISVALLIGAGVLIGHGLWSQATRSASGFVPFPRSQPAPNSNGTSGGGPSNAAAIAARVDPALVDINTTLSYQQVQAAGTGMVLTPDGLILTNNHVIEGATNISVTDVGNGKTYGATVLGYDITKDLALLQLRGASGLQTVTLGNSTNVSVGQSVVAAGNAGGAGGTPSYAGGSVTALNQSISASDDFGGNSEQLSGLIQSNANIQQGDSGGALVTTDGKVIGVTTAASSGFAFQGGGNSYFIPINSANTVVRQIKSGQGTSTVHVGATAFLGLIVEPIGQAGIGPSGGTGSGQGGSQQGIAVVRVVTGEPADQAGLSTGDIITTVDGSAVNTPSALTTVLLRHHPGDTIQIAWTDSGGQTHSSSVQLASGPPQ